MKKKMKPRERVCLVVSSEMAVRAVVVVLVFVSCSTSTVQGEFVFLLKRVNILPNSAPPPGDGRNKQISENEEDIKVYYCLALKP